MITKQEFEAFFPVFSDMLERVPVTEPMSWDRRAAYMLLMYGKTQDSFPQFVAWLRQQPKVK